MAATIKQIQQASQGWSIEVTPAGAKKIDSFKECLPTGTTVNVTFLPGTDAEDTVAVAARLHKEGMRAVPHLAARSLKDKDQIDMLLEAYRAKAGVDEVLIIGGGVNHPIGAFDNSIQILETGLLQKHGIRRVGVAGHPEGSPDISDYELAEALAAKNILAEREGFDMYIETQFCFEALVVLEWEKSIRDAGNKLPIRIGIPGPATIKSLLKFAKISGIGPSMQFVSKHARNVTKLMMVQSPHLLLCDLAQGMADDPDCLIRHFHFYPFGGFVKTAIYADAISSGKIELLSKGGFEVADTSA